METVTVRMSRGDRTTPWGFGVTEAPSRDVVIVNVVPGSLADRAGLRNGDVLDELEALRNLDINATDRLLVTSRDKIELVVHRNGSGGGAARVWKPEITPQTEMSKFQHSVHNMGPASGAQSVPFKVSLEHNNSTVPPKGFNANALPFNTDPRVKHLQYNSPLGLYSNQSAAEQYQQQTAGVVSSDAPRQSDQPAYLRSETLRLLKEQEGNQSNGYSSSLSSHPNPHGLPTCYVCTRPILGVMAKAAGHTIHGDCLSCATCGSSLKNIGHHFLEGKFYCDIHARLKRGTSQGIDPNQAVRSPPSAANPVRPVENLRGQYQPDVMGRRPLSVSPSPQQWNSQSHSVNVSVTNPRTQGAISPSARGVPTSAMYGQDLRGGASRAASTAPSHAPSDYRPMSVNTLAPPVNAPPPPPSNPPPGESRIPTSVRCAVSPRRKERLPRQWPPPKGLPTHAYWNIAPHQQAHQPVKENVSLTDFIHEMDQSEERSERVPRRLKIIERTPSGTEVHRQSPSVVVRMDSRRENLTDHRLSQPVELRREERKLARTGSLQQPYYEETNGRQQSNPQSSHYEPDEAWGFSQKDEHEKLVEAEHFIEQTPAIYHGKLHTTNVRIMPEEIHREPENQNIQQVHSYQAEDEEDENYSQHIFTRDNPLRYSKTNVDVTKNPHHSRQQSHYQVSQPTRPFIAHYHEPVNSNVKERIPAPPPLNQPVEPICKTDAITEPPREISESSDQSSLSEPHAAPTKQTEESGKKLKKKPGRTDPRRLTAIHIPTNEEEKVMSDEPTTPTRSNANLIYQSHSSNMKALSPRPFHRPPSPPKDYPVERGTIVTVTLNPAIRSVNPDDASLIGINVAARPFRSPEPPTLSSMRRGQYEESLSRPNQLSDLPALRPRGSQQPVQAPKENLKKVDSSPRSSRHHWREASEIVDESDIMTDASNSRRSDDESTAAPASELSDYPKRYNTYDIDESELVNFRKGQDDTDIDSDDEKERWMREELELARKEELQGHLIPTRAVPQKDSFDVYSVQSESDDWRKQAMQLLDDESQFDRDMILVAKLNQQINECKHLEDGDRQKAIQCMKRHQKTLENKQEKLARLLDSAINYVSNMEDSIIEEQPQMPQPATVPQPPVRKHFKDVDSHPANPIYQANCQERDILEELSRLSLPVAPPPRKYLGSSEERQTSNAPVIPAVDYDDQQPIHYTARLETEQLSSVLDELNNIMAPRSSDFIARKIHNIQEEAKASNYSSTKNSSYERTETNANLGSGALTQATQGGKTPYCEACKGQIRGAFVLAQGLSWCPEHFICANTACARRLLECGFVEENGQKYCETCFENNIAPRCAKCVKPITSDCLNALQKKWHPQCFTCAHCSKAFGNSAFYLEQGLPYCEADWNRLFTTKCYQCTYPIEAGDRWVEALGHAYHSNCFNCTRCNINLEGESFYAKNGEPFCKQHA